MGSNRSVQVVIVGGGPAGTLLSHLLVGEGIDVVVLERRSADHVLGRIRAGVLEYGSAQTVRSAGLGKRLDTEGFRHEGVNLTFGERSTRIDFDGLTGKYVTVYGQTEVQKDLYDAAAGRPDTMIFEAGDVTLHGVDSDSPSVTYRHQGRAHTITCDWVVGCDGQYGPSRDSIPVAARRTFERTYPFGWLGVLSETPPVTEELIYANSDDGFALCSMRNKNLSRYYVQCPLDTDTAEWPDDRFWQTLAERLPRSVADTLVTGPSIEKSITPLRSFVAEPMRWGRLLLAGDATHVVPPTGAKGLNLALGDAVYAFRALADHYASGSTAGLEEYSVTALSRVWKAVRFSWWMTRLLHKFPGTQGEGFDQRIQLADYDYLQGSEAARTSLAENYVGLPL